MRRDTERLQDILEAIANIQRYTNQGRSPFNQNELIQIWVIYYLQVIGEAANALSEGLKIQHPDILWARIIGFRNVVVHEYFRIDLNLVWAIVENDLPDLKSRIEQILQEAGEAK